MLVTAAAAILLSASPVYTTGVFQLVRDVSDVPDQPCEAYTRLILDRAELSGPIAFLSERYAGDCQMSLDRSARHYPLFHEQTDKCGSEIWKGSFLRAGAYQLRVVDHRPRRCDDDVAAKVIVEETSPGGDVVTLYAVGG